MVAKKSVDSVNDIYHPLPQLRIYSVACSNGWEAASRKHSTGGDWSKEGSSLHITNCPSIYNPVLFHTTFETSYT